MKKEFKNKSILNKKVMTTIYGGNRTLQMGTVTGNGGSVPGQLSRLPREFN